MKIRLLFMLFTISCFAQNEQKIDSVFNYHFKILEMELGKTSPGKLDQNNIYYNEIILDNGQKVYVNKYARESMIFFEELTKIQRPISEGYSIRGKLDLKTFKLWKKWYKNNNDKLLWSDERKKPYLNEKNSKK